MVDPKDIERENFVMDDGYPEEAASESRTQPYHASASDVFKKKPLIPIVIGSLGLVILVILFARFFSAPRSEVDLDYVHSLETRISDLENQLLKRAELNQTIDRIAQQESRMNSIGQQLNRFESTVTTQIDQIIKEIGLLHQKRAHGSPATKPKPKTAAKKRSVTSPKPKSTPRFHVVQSGETLYRISRRYGLTVDQLQSFNNLAPDAAIYPGQKLKIEKP